MPKPGRRERPREVEFREVINAVRDVELMLDRERTGKAPHAQTRGYDAGKKIFGRKRHIAVDTDGRLLMINTTPADISDSAGRWRSLKRSESAGRPWVKHLFADGAYDRLIITLMDKATPAAR